MSYLSLFYSFFKIGLIGFGGGATIVAISYNEFVNKRKCITKEQFSDYYAMSQTFPGVVAVNFSAFVGNSQRGFMGGLVAVFGMILPAVVSILALASVMTQISDTVILRHALNGVRLAVIILLLNMTRQQAQSSVHHKLSLFIMCLTFLLLSFKIPPVYPLIASGVFGCLFYKKKGRIYK